MIISVISAMMNGVFELIIVRLAMDPSVYHRRWSDDGSFNIVCAVMLFQMRRRQYDGGLFGSAVHVAVGITSSLPSSR